MTTITEPPVALTNCPHMIGRQTVGMSPRESITKTFGIRNAGRCCWRFQVGSSTGRFIYKLMKFRNSKKDRKLCTIVMILDL